MAKTKRSAAAIPLKERTYYCAVCTKPFTPEKWNQKTCCPAHANELERRKHREKLAEKVEEKHSERFCIIEECRKPFKPRNNQHLCCSTECSDLRKNRLAIQRRNEKREVYASDVGSMPAPGVAVMKTPELIEEVNKRGYYTLKAEDLRTDLHHTIDTSRFHKAETVRLGIVSDTHFTSIYQQLTALHEMYRYFADVGIEKVLHCGDLFDGDGKQHKGQWTEHFIHGGSAQLEYGTQMYPQEDGIETLFITGSHDNSFNKSCGWVIGEELEKARPDLTYLGHSSAFVHIENIKIQLFHPSGGVPYARSYRLQKVVEQLPPETKPHIHLCGHLHGGCWLPGYRNVEAIMVGCFEAQTPYLREKALFPFISGAILEYTKDDDGLVSTNLTWYPTYVPRENDFGYSKTWTVPRAV